MNRSARTAETVSDVYLALMLSAFLLWTGPDGYTKILEAKYRLFLLLTIVYCAAAALSSLRQIRTVDRKSTRLNSSHTDSSRMPSSA